MIVHKLISTGLGIGYINKGAGTAAAFATCLFIYFFQSSSFQTFSGFPLLITVLITALGVWSANKVEKEWGKDHNRVVIDEISGMAITLLFLPFSVTTLCIGFVLFRFFDILKPLYIRRLEMWKGGWGVMADDVLAGIYSNLILQSLLLLNVL